MICNEKMNLKTRRIKEPNYSHILSTSCVIILIVTDYIIGEPAFYQTLSSLFFNIQKKKNSRLYNTFLIRINYVKLSQLRT